MMYISALYSPGKMGGPPPGLMQVVPYPEIQRNVRVHRAAAVVVVHDIALPVYNRSRPRSARSTVSAAAGATGRAFAAWPRGSCQEFCRLVDPRRAKFADSA